MWVKHGLKLSLGLLLLLCFSFSVYSLDLKGKTPEEIANLAEITKGELTRLLDERSTFNTTLTQLQKENKIFKEESTARMQELTLLKLTSQIQIDSLTSLEKEITWEKVEVFLGGILLGYAGNELKGDIMEAQNGD